VDAIGSRIKKLREQLVISQQELADKLGVSRPAVSQIESGARKICAEELKKLADIFNISVDGLLNLEKEPLVLVRENKETYQAKPEIRINVPQKNLAKFKEVLLYILNRVGSKPNIGETVIYKLLYFIDFDYYEKYEEQLIGATYLKNKYGPTPIEFGKIVENMIKAKEITKVKDKYFTYPQTKYLPLRKPDLVHLKASEIAVINNVLSRLSDKNAKEVSDYSHNDVPWLTTQEGKIIEYESVFYRTAPYSVREYNEDIQ
jgi:transcriptional regulator with XRE-family HTH domain